MNGAAVSERVLKTRYWFGSKALYAIALRYGSVYDIRKAIGMGTYVAYFLLAISLLLSPKMFLPAMPLLVFGASFSGIHYWSDVANGLPYLWTVLFAAGLAVFTGLAGHDAPRRWRGGRGRRARRRTCVVRSGGSGGLLLRRRNGVVLPVAR